MRRKHIFSAKERLIRLLRFHRYDRLPIVYTFILFSLIGCVLTGIGYSFETDKVVTKEVKKDSDYNTEVNKIFEHNRKMNELAKQLNLTSPITEERKTK